jgi:hypothetical protein
MVKLKILHFSGGGGGVSLCRYGLLLFILQELQFIHGQKQTYWKQCEMGVDTGLYRARTGLFGIRQCSLLVNNHTINIVRSGHTRFFGLITAVMLIVGGVELNPGPQMEKKLHAGTERIDERYK